MGELGLNKIFAALLATALVILGVGTLSGLVIGGGGHHHGGHHHDEGKSQNEIFAEKYAYFIEVEDDDGADTSDEAPAFDLGLALASADLSRGERAFGQQCAQCHTLEEGQPNGVGPNLYNVVGAQKGEKAGFNYSGTLSNWEGAPWNYEELNEWLIAPARYAPGTTMSYAGLRRDADRVAVIAYLAEYAANPPAFPAPLAAEEEASIDTGEADVQSASLDTVEAPTATPAADAPVEDAVRRIEVVVDETVRDAEAALEDIVAGETRGDD